MESSRAAGGWLTLDLRSLGLFRAALGLSLLVDITRRIADALSELQATLLAALVLAGLIVAWVAAARFFLGHKSSAGETLWTWLAYLVAYYASSVESPPADKVLACLLLWCVGLPVGARLSLDALVRLVRPPGESQRPEPRPAANYALLGVALQTSVILGSLALSALGGEPAGAPRAFGWLLAAAAVGAFAAPWASLPGSLRAAAAAIVLAALAWNVSLHAGEAWAWTLLAAALAFIPGDVWERLALWTTPRRPLTCYFDDDCGICQAVRRTLSMLDRGSNIVFLGNSDPSAFRHAVPLELTERTIVVFDERGRMLIETRAVAALLSALPWPWRMGAALGIGGLADLADVGYRWVARNRLHISVWLGLAACGVGPQPEARVAQVSSQLGVRQRSATWAAILLALMLLRAYNANLAGFATLRALPEPRHLRAFMQLGLFDQDWRNVGRGAA
ncbi:MAG: DUF393 domain-containing protein [Pirellulales bacterium]